VTNSCPHESDSILNIDPEKKEYIGQLMEGLHFHDSRASSAMIGNKHWGNAVYVQHTEGNPTAQWLALQWMPDDDSQRCLRILQRDCCISCLLNLAGDLVKSISNSSAPVLAKGYPICIIAGNNKGALGNATSTRGLNVPKTKTGGPTSISSSALCQSERPQRSPVRNQGRDIMQQQRPQPPLNPQGCSISRKPIPKG
jgi:hypothetical protein